MKGTSFPGKGEYTMGSAMMEDIWNAFAELDHLETKRQRLSSRRPSESCPFADTRFLCQYKQPSITTNDTHIPLMAFQRLTLIEYVPRTRQHRRRLELQEATVRAHVARVNHERRHSRTQRQSHPDDSPSRTRDKKGRPLEQNLSLEAASLMPNDNEPSDKTTGSVRDVKNFLRVHMKTPTKDVAVNFTLINFIEGSYFDYIPQLCLSTSSHGTLRLVLECIALANFARFVRRDDLLLMSRSLHQKFLQHIRIALDNSETACADETLAAVLLVAYFGFVDGSSVEKATVAREQHLNGAISILRLRSAKRKSSVIGDKMVLQTWDNVALRAHCKRERVPMDVSVLLQKTCFTDAGRRRWKTESGKVVWLWSRRCADVRAAWSAASRGEIDVNPVVILEETLKLIGRHEIYREYQDIWPYTTCTTDLTRPGVWQGAYHIYPNGESAWMADNLYRMSTIWLRRIVIDCCQELLEQDLHDTLFDHPLSLSEIISESKMDIERMALEICKCVPQHLDPGFAKNKYQQLWMRRGFKQSRFKTCPQSVKTSSSIKKALLDTLPDGGLHIPSAGSLIWPLYAAGSATRSEKLRDYTVDRLQYIAAHCNNCMATVAADRLLSGDFNNDAGLDMAFTL